MADEQLDRDYARVLETSRRKGDLLEGPAGEERRAHPRVRVNPGDLPTELDPWVFALDISISGMAFYSDEPVAPGKTVSVNLGEELFAEAEVLNCQAEESGSPQHPTRYRLHCRFADEEAGKRLLVTIKDLERTGGKPD